MRKTIGLWPVFALLWIGGWLLRLPPPVTPPSPAPVLAGHYTDESPLDFPPSAALLMQTSESALGASLALRRSTEPFLLPEPMTWKGLFCIASAVLLRSVPAAARRSACAFPSASRAPPFSL